MRIIIEPNADTVAEYAANYIKRRILEFNPGPDRYFVMGLPTGGTPVKTYRKLVEYVAGLTDRFLPSPDASSRKGKIGSFINR